MKITRKEAKRYKTFSMAVMELDEADEDGDYSDEKIKQVAKKYGICDPDELYVFLLQSHIKRGNDYANRLLHKFLITKMIERGSHKFKKG